MRNKTLFEALQPYLDTPVRIAYMNRTTSLIFDKVIRAVHHYRTGGMLMVFDDGVIFFEQKITAKQRQEFLVIEPIERNGGRLCLARWADLPEEFRPYSEEMAEIVGR